MIELYVYNGNIQVRKYETLTSGRVGHQIYITFDKKWANLPKKKITFQAGNNAVTIPETFENNEIITQIPVEVLRKPNYDLYISIKGYDNEYNNILPTRYVRLGLIHQGNETFSSESEQLIIEKESGELELDIASDEEVNEMLDEVFSNIGIEIASDTEINEMLNEIF